MWSTIGVIAFCIVVIAFLTIGLALRQAAAASFVAQARNREARGLIFTALKDQLDEESGVRGYQATTAYRKALRKRKVWPEPLFAEAKQWHGLRRFRLRGLQNVNMEGLLVATGQNLKRWLAATGWGRRHGPPGSLAVASPTPAPLPR